MTAIASRGKRLNSVLAHEYAPEYGYCRKDVTVTIEAGMDVGNALKLAAGKWVWIEAADVATLPADVAVLVETEKDVPSLAVGDHTLTVIFRGPAGLKDVGLTFKDALTTNQKATVHAAFEAKGMAVRTAI